jgi:hypothetical protein
MPMNGVRKIGYVLVMVVATLAMQSVAAACAWDDCCDCCPCCQPGCGTPGYWMNHPDAWPPDFDSITIGGETYTKDEAIALMKAPVKGDKALILFPQLVAAELNVAIGNCDCCIADIIELADEWLAENPIGSPENITKCDWKEGECYYECLEAYNSGRLCAPSRDSVEECDD